MSRTVHIFGSSFLALAAAGALRASTGDGAPCLLSTAISGLQEECGVGALDEPLQPRGINNLGDWVGFRNFCGDANSYQTALSWTAEFGVRSLPVPPSTVSTQAYGVNDQGTAVGVRIGMTNGLAHGDWACIWIGSDFIEVPPMGGDPPHSAAVAVNNWNVVVGWRNTSLPALRSAFVWSNGVVLDIDPVQYGFTSAEAVGISDAGVVTGVLYGPTTMRAFQWQAGSLTILEPLAGALYSRARAIGQSGMVVGHSEFPAEPGLPGQILPTIWDGQSAATLPLLPGYSCGACQAIAGNGVILGRAFRPIQAGLPNSQWMLWIAGVPHALGSLVEVPSTSQLGTAWAMSDSGKVLGSGPIPVVPAGSAWVLSPTASRADLNMDCVVDGADLAILLEAWGPESRSGADIDNDGKVDGADLGALLGSWS